ncbi:glycosyl hydrolase family 18 protein [Streptomyces sp. SL13]|uniref:chitinase n=1 Tax=Streptantibioticus silvisoli TaxID=2705255 RepID=A0AA90KEN5_9ACTN|nr:glycosyl hydrolase family 18 protein [Streptantibioticus silvisoli]MDI5961624.1 glycosyl hydrolase family 18 protein [Streptantibioticus silvisoli]MDI5968205.1 glycosyl hydrolase family 18 protein [Streptantibioticus silvisoli]
MRLMASRPRRRVTLAFAAAATAILTAFAPSAASAAAAAPALTGTEHVVAYYQTQYDNGTYVSPSPLNGIATDVEVAAFHLNGDGTIHLNDDPPSDPKFNQMWTDLAAMQSSGVRVEAMLGGAAAGSYANLHNDFNTYYALLKNTLQTYHFNGIDLDIEESFSLADTEHLISQLRTDFGSSFVITLAPVASDLSGGSSFSGGFSYKQLESDMGSQINWYNAQFYCGWGDLSSTSGYDAVLANGFAASRVVAGTVTNPGTCSGYVDPGTLAGTVRSLASEHSDFGGVAGWEYFNAEGVNGGGPASWYGNVRDAMG